jgi:hypothetical protein
VTVDRSPRLLRRTSGRSRRLLRVAATTLALGLVLAIGLFAFSWFWVGKLLRVHPVAATYSLHVLALGDNTITLERRGDSTLSGTYGLEWTGGHAVLGRVVRATPDEVVRRICLIDGRPPRRGMTIGFRNNVYWSDPAQVGLRFRNVEIPADTGALPAWFVPARRRTWAILVHGLGGSRQDALQVMPTLHALGLPILDISYRNDGTAPRAAGGLSHLGASEWRDLAAAIGYARAHGAAKVVVFGYSLSAAILEELLVHSRQAPAIAGLILDSPVLDWKRTIAAEGARHHVPARLLDLAVWILVARTGLHVGDVSVERFSRLLTVPMLLIHGSADTVIPVTTSDQFAAMNRRRVTYYRPTGVEHVRAWNADPAGYERRLIRFLRRVRITSRGKSLGPVAPAAPC